MGSAFKYVGKTKKARAGGVLFEQNKTMTIDNAALAKKLRENKEFEEVKGKIEVNVVAKNPDLTKPEVPDAKPGSTKSHAGKS